MIEIEPCKIVFCKRVGDYLTNIEAGQLNIYGSNDFDMLNIASDFGVLYEIVNMTRLGHH